MKTIIKTEEQLVELFKKMKKAIAKEALIVEVEKFSNQRTNKQLRSFWLLISVVRNYFLENGNQWSSEDVANYFKIKSGLYQEIDGVKIPLSIADKAHRTKEQMEMLIDCILEFGAENNIENCYLLDEEREAILSSYN